MKLQFNVILVIFMTITVSGQQVLPDETPKCRLLSLSGGGSKGAYEVGAMQQIIELLPAE